MRPTTEAIRTRAELQIAFMLISFAMNLTIYTIHGLMVKRT
jgi:hypothetical protein